MLNNDSNTTGTIMESICIKYGCDFAVDLDGQVTCTNCGGRDDEKMTIGIKND